MINDCLLRLLLEVFAALQQNPIVTLRTHFEKNAEKLTINETVEKFDEITDRLLQIGMFGVAFSSDYRGKLHCRLCTIRYEHYTSVYCILCIVKCTIASAMASLEALDSFLIPSICSTSDKHSQLLIGHWTDEVNSLQHSIQSIIDTNAFCSTVIELLRSTIARLTKAYDVTLATSLLSKLNILLRHFAINFDELRLDNESMRKLHYDDIQLMMKECLAAVEQCSTDECYRVVKRFKILLSSIKKFQITLNVTEGNACEFGNVTAVNTQNFACTTQTISDSMKVMVSNVDVTNTDTFFSDNGIFPVRNSILYRSSRRQLLSGECLSKSTAIRSPIKSVKKSL